MDNAKKMTTYPGWIGFRNSLNLTRSWTITFKHNSYLFLQWGLGRRRLNRDRDSCMVFLVSSLAINSIHSNRFCLPSTTEFVAWSSALRLHPTGSFFSKATNEVFCTNCSPIHHYIVIYDTKKVGFHYKFCIQPQPCILPCTFWALLEWTLQRFPVEFDRNQESQTHSLYQLDQPEISKII